MILYQGPSRLDGALIVVIATGLKKKSVNSKTGAMVQTWVLRADMSPLDAVKTGEDFSICGDCVHRGSKDSPRTCYVTLAHAPLAVWKAYKRGSYLVADPYKIAQTFEGRAVRLGSYGDPAAVPWDVWALVTARARSWTGYTHQWKRTDQHYQHLLMASADSPDEALHAQSLGWRTFRVGLGVMPGEVSCPASEEAGKVTTCERCGLCAGSSREAKSVTIQPHGVSAKRLTRRILPVAS